VGQLAAGIAHDFNNIMATIVLYSQMSARADGVPDPIRERMVTINQQALHATKLTRQILDFSRHSVLERRSFDLFPFLKEQVRLLERTMPESIEIKLDYGPGEYIVNADPTRMQQMVTNLSVNARDAMPEGGTLRIGLERIRVEDRREAPLPELEAGVWVQVTVSDTGIGIPPDALLHIFDPFFTTKPASEGTGLGLSQVWGIVKHHEGHIDVTTQEGEGTTFTVYLPALQASQPMALLQEELLTLPQGQGETILVVEDNTDAREALVDSLRVLNYRVLAAANGREALDLFKQHAEKADHTRRIALVVSDVVMPEMGGVALLHALREKNYKGQIIMLTGHPMHDTDDDLRLQGVMEWLQKPVSLEQLADVLARAVAGGSA
jgi:CheY-like chemotaxis protein